MFCYLDVGPTPSLKIVTKYEENNKLSIWDKDYIRCLRDFNLLLWLPMVSCVVMIALKFNSLYIDEEGGCSKGKMKIVRKI